MDHNAKFDLIVLSEVLEHVDHIDRVLEHAADLLADDGRVVISTINSTLRARVETIWVAEHLLNLVPVGTHDFAKYQSPEGIQAKLHKVGLEPVQVQKAWCCPNQPSSCGVSGTGTIQPTRV